MVFLSRWLGFGKALLPRTIAARGIPVLLGVVLLTAATLKTHQLATGTSQENGLFTSRWLLIGLVELELALGFWLLAGAYPKQARRMALAVFAGFSLVSLHQALTGAPSCGCFGKISVKPWHTLLFDLAAAALLWRWRPGIYKRMFIYRGGAQQQRNIRSRSFHLTALGLLFVLAGVPAAIAMNRPRPALLQSSLSALDFGTMPQGERGEIVFWLDNPNPETVEIAEIGSSCDCFRIDLDKRTVPGGEKIRAVAHLELDKEPRFSGELQPEAHGRTPAGDIAFSIQARVQVVRKSFAQRRTSHEISIWP
jgi:hypothetical protein